MPKHEDFRTTREEEHRRIKQGAMERGITERDADRWATERVEKAMPGVVRMREDEGTSRPIEIRSK